MQWGLDGKLKINKFRIDGSVRADDFENILKEFMSCDAVMSILEISGNANIPIEMENVKLKSTVRSMEFFDKLIDADSGIVGPTGNIGGCFEESFDGVTTGDLLRDLIVNPDSANSQIFSAGDKMEFIYRLFRIFSIGGTLCQPDHNIQRYLDTTKSFYKDLQVIYRASDSDEIREAVQVFDVLSVTGLDLFNGSSRNHSCFLVAINHIEKTVTSIKMDYQSYW
eukprot:CAMPEP_0114426650 /NCGR_PEP_ID=MMETSP0103-20121206/7915_1 /TAXON_ID=37642 ORGANISM="Paraphysomonas imperforata, Strain PA2" /NCGR_SAMPLE_ID=MMETSP0103 /ASSEMBLY_ACC=CAM_ASM_000201 /LENGTH=223 /DNA_ID=CAMNT_0001595633 /DNA_START=270 /DNA_END=941 /DNA_ORIENTATION=+